MTNRKNSRDLIKAGAVVGTIHSAESLRAARRLAGGIVDFLEVRVDAFAATPEVLLRGITSLRAPLIVTVRDPVEGGQNQMALARRRAGYAQFLPHAALLDVELRNVRALAATLAAARERGVGVIVSFHDFRATPSAARLREIVRRAALAGADVIKIATRADRPGDLQRLLALFASRNPRPLSVMAMGNYGRISRLLFAHSGSVLNYCSLATANASGQWAAADFRKRLAEVSS